MPPYADVKLSRTALEGVISILGEIGAGAIIKDLKSRGVYNVDSEYLDLARVADSLERFFGASAVELLLERSKQRTRELVGSGVLS